ncbi:flagellin [Candidatus Methylomirabilis sp.]|uniref:flagellin N-terminal helical domain-containing protein n=1 Tax=Candidatus Methylomirabilis sp. TaxID=2032687 RepID=UPI002A678593|nr:flagellin [Candidatus Methylomirabilis sp.]
MRITSNTIFHQLTADINRSANRLFELQRQVASSKRMATASDDPIGAGLAVSLHESLAQLLQAQRNADQAEARLQASQGVLTDILSELGDVKDLAFRGVDGALTDSDRQNLATQVNQKLEQLLADANARSIDGYLFGGTQTSVAPFTATRNANGDITAVSANSLGTGIAGQVDASLPSGLTVVVNVPGSTVLTSTSPQTVDIFPLLIAVRDQLRAGNVAGVELNLTNLDTAVDQVRVVSADVGSRIGRIRDIQQRSQSDLLTLRGRLSKIEDTDIAEASIEFQQAQNVYQAALAAASKVVQINLIDFLR